MAQAGGVSSSSLENFEVKNQWGFVPDTLRPFDAKDSLEG